MKKSQLGLLLTALLLTGCASTMDSFYNRPVIEDDLEGVIATASLSADRRTVIVKLLGNDAGKFCAEPPPDVAQNITTSLDASLKVKLAKAPAEADGSIKDTLDKEIVVLAERTVLLDIYRTGTYALCQYHLNGAISDNELIKKFDMLTTGVINGLANVK